MGLEKVGISETADTGIASVVTGYKNQSRVSAFKNHAVGIKAETKLYLTNLNQT